MGTQQLMSRGSLPTDATLLRAVLDAAPEPLWVISPDGFVALANDAAAGLLGFSRPHDIIGLPSHDTLHSHRPDGSDYAAADCPIVNAAHTRVAPAGSTTTEWFITRSGAPLPVNWSTRPLEVGGAILLSFARTLEAAHPKSTPTCDALRDELQGIIADRFFEPDFSVTSLAREARMSIRTIQLLFAECGSTPAAAIRQARLNLARGLLSRGATVTRACFESGFADTTSFARTFRRSFGMSPSQFRDTRTQDV